MPAQECLEHAVTGTEAHAVPRIPDPGLDGLNSRWPRQVGGGQWREGMTEGRRLGCRKVDQEADWVQDGWDQP